MLNSTIISGAETIASQLYAGVNFDTLNWAEKLWASWYIWIGNPSVATGLMSFILHEVCSLLSSREWRVLMVWWCRLSILEDVYPGLLSIIFLTLGSGSYNPYVLYSLEMVFVNGM